VPQQVEPPEILDTDIQAAREKIARLEEYQALQRRIEQLEAEIQPQRERRSTPLRRQRSHSPSDRSGRDIKVQNISIFTLDFSLQRRLDWLFDLSLAFRGAPHKYRSDEKKIIAAIGYMDHFCRSRWHRHITEKTPEEQQDAEASWDYFEQWTLTLIQNAATMEADVRELLEKAQQRVGQDPREFNAYLDTLEQHFPRETERGRALTFYTKLTKELRDFIRAHNLHLPETRDEMVQTASMYWSLQGNRKRKDTESSSNQPRNKARKQSRYDQNKDRSSQDQRGSNQGQQKRLNPIGRDGKRLRCFNCDGEDHLSPTCPKGEAKQKQSKVQSATHHSQSSTYSESTDQYSKNDSESE
jgi:hypothetical protein